MNISGTDRTPRALLTGVLLAILLLMAAPSQADSTADDATFRGSASLGAHLYAIDNPFDNDNVTGFFDQYRSIENKGAGVPYFLDLMHLDLGLVRPDGTHLLRVERWSRNAINANSRLDINWRGLVASTEIRRYRSDALRFFPTGTEDDWTGAPSGLGFGTIYNPDVPGLITGSSSNIDALFGANYRIGIERFDLESGITLRPDGFGHSDNALREVRLRAGYGSRTGHRQDSFLLDFTEADDPTSRFRGNRRSIDQNVASAGTGATLSLAESLNASVSFDVERFREAADIVTLGDLSAMPGNVFTPASTDPASLDREFFFVPDTNRYTGSLRLTHYQGSGTLNAGIFATHLEQTGRLSKLQTRYSLGQNSVTTVSAHLDGSIPLASKLDLSGFVKYIYRANDIDEDAFVALDLPAGNQESPYMKRRSQVRGSLEIGATPRASTRIAIGYRLDWVDRDLVYPTGSAGIQPGLSLIHPRSSSHRLFLKGRARFFRSLQVSGELGHFWAPDVAYPNDLSEAVSFRARGSYSLDHRVANFPVHLSFSGRLVDGENNDFELPGPGAVSNGDRRPKYFARTDWGYDLTLTVVPRTSLAVYGTFSQSGDEQASDYVRTTLARSAGGGAFYIDSIPHYDSDLKSLRVGGTLSDLHGASLGFSSALTWAKMTTRGAAGVGSNVGGLIGDANRIDSRILTVNADLSTTLREGIGAGFGYRYQQFIDGAQLDPLDLDETIHTVTLKLTADF